ncbi:MAG: ABC transporter substrate-binding protein [Actinobacteria bacterium]|nr:ABC transporter substrate-binding protein [Actinomycetota bacterium]
MASRRSALRTVLVISAVMSALVVAGCGGGGATGSGGSEAKAKPGGTLRVAQFSEALTLNPFEAVDNASEQVFIQVLEPLYKIAPDGEPEPWLVTGAKPSNDYKTWTLDLRKGVKFSTGKPMSAEDVVFSLEELTNSETWGAIVEPITAIKATSPTTVQVTSSKPFPGLPAALTLPFAVIVEKNFGGASPKAFGQHPVGTGPFEFAGWEHGQAVNLTRNPHYWKPNRPLLEKVVITAPPSDQSRVLQLRGEQVDVIATPPWAQLASLETTPGLRVEKSSLAVLHYILLNVKTPVFKDRRVREAVSLALDRESINEATLRGQGQLAGSWLMPAVNYWDAGIKPPTPDQAKASALLAEVVKEKGLNPTFTLIISSGEEYESLASQIVQEDLEKVGFKVTIKQVDPSSKSETVTTGHYEAAIELVSTDIAEPSELAAFYVLTEGFFSGADTSRMSTLLDRAGVEANKAKLKQLYGEVQEHVAEEDEMIPLTYQPWVWVTRDNVAGFKLSPLGLPSYADVGFSE